MTDRPSANNCSGLTHHTQPSFNKLEVIVESASDEVSILSQIQSLQSKTFESLEVAATNSFGTQTSTASVQLRLEAKKSIEEVSAGYQDYLQLQRDNMKFKKKKDQTEIIHTGAEVKLKESNQVLGRATANLNSLAESQDERIQNAVVGAYSIAKAENDVASLMYKQTSKNYEDAVLQLKIQMDTVAELKSKLESQLNAAQLLYQDAINVAQIEARSKEYESMLDDQNNEPTIELDEARSHDFEAALDDQKSEAIIEPVETRNHEYDVLDNQHTDQTIVTDMMNSRDDGDECERQDKSRKGNGEKLVENHYNEDMRYPPETPERIVNRGGLICATCDDDLPSEDESSSEEYQTEEEDNSMLNTPPRSYRYHSNSSSHTKDSDIDDEETVVTDDEEELADEIVNENKELRKEEGEEDEGKITYENLINGDERTMQEEEGLVAIDDLHEEELKEVVEGGYEIAVDDFRKEDEKIMDEKEIEEVKEEEEVDKEIMKEKEKQEVASVNESKVIMKKTEEGEVTTRDVLINVETNSLTEDVMGEEVNDESELKYKLSTSGNLSKDVSMDEAAVQVAEFAYNEIEERHDMAFDDLRNNVEKITHEEEIEEEEVDIDVDEFNIEDKSSMKGEKEGEITRKNVDKAAMIEAEIEQASLAKLKNVETSNLNENIFNDENELKFKLSTSDDLIKLVTADETAVEAAEFALSRAIVDATSFVSDEYSEGHRGTSFLKDHGKGVISQINSEENFCGNQHNEFDESIEVSVELYNSFVHDSHDGEALLGEEEDEERQEETTGDKIAEELNMDVNDSGDYENEDIVAPNEEALSSKEERADGSSLQEEAEREATNVEELSVKSSDLLPENIFTPDRPPSRNLADATTEELNEEMNMEKEEAIVVSTPPKKKHTEKLNWRDGKLCDFLFRVKIISDSTSDMNIGKNQGDDGENKKFNRGGDHSVEILDKEVEKTLEGNKDIVDNEEIVQRNLPKESTDENFVSLQGPGNNDVNKSEEKFVSLHIAAGVGLKEDKRFEDSSVGSAGDMVVALRNANDEDLKPEEEKGLEEETIVSTGNLAVNGVKQEEEMCCEEGQENVDCYPVHKILFTCNPRYNSEEIRQKINASINENESNITFELLQGGATHFLLFLDFMYHNTDAFRAGLTSKSAVALRYLGKECGITALRKVATNFIKKDFCDITCVDYLSEAEAFSEVKLRAAAIDVCAAMFINLNDEDMGRIPFQTVIEIIQSKKFRARSVEYSIRMAKVLQSNTNNFTKTEFLVISKVDLMPEVDPSVAPFYLEWSIGFDMERESNPSEHNISVYDRCIESIACHWKEVVVDGVNNEESGNSWFARLPQDVQMDVMRLSLLRASNGNQ